MNQKNGCLWSRKIQNPGGSISLYLASQWVFLWPNRLIHTFSVLPHIFSAACCCLTTRTTRRQLPQQDLQVLKKKGRYFVLPQLVVLRKTRSFELCLRRSAQLHNFHMGMLDILHRLVTIFLHYPECSHANWINVNLVLLEVKWWHTVVWVLVVLLWYQTAWLLSTHASYIS